MLGVIIYALGLLGEYIGRIYQQVRARPRYLVQTILEQRDGHTSVHKPLQEAVHTIGVVQREEQGR
jgi:undecaprenyl-phosphate 4-deoxy-4-formamido-L-arabinose transferase